MLTRIQRLFGLVCLGKAVDWTIRAPEAIPHVGWAFVVLWVVASVGLATGRRVELSSATVAILSVGAPFLSGWVLYNFHLWLLASVGAVFALMRPAEQFVSLRLLVSAMYLFAGLAKINGVWLSGVVLHTTVERGPFSWGWMPEPVWAAGAVAVVAVELWMSVGLWFRRARDVTVAVGVLLHLGMVVTMLQGVVQASQFVAFAGGPVVLYLAFYAEAPALRRPRNDQAVAAS